MPPTRPVRLAVATSKRPPMGAEQRAPGLGPRVPIGDRVGVDGAGFGPGRGRRVFGDEVDQDLGHDGRTHVGAVAGLPSIGCARVRMGAGRQDRVAVGVMQDVDAGRPPRPHLLAEPPFFGPRVELGHAEADAGVDPPDVPTAVTASRQVDASVRVGGADLVAQRRPGGMAAVAGVDVQHDVVRADAMPDQRPGPAFPPRRDDLYVGGRLVLADERALVGRVDGEDLEPSLGVEHRVVAQVPNGAESLGHTTVSAPLSRAGTCRQAPTGLAGPAAALAGSEAALVAPVRPQHRAGWWTWLRWAGGSRRRRAWAGSGWARAPRRPCTARPGRRRRL